MHHVLSPIGLICKLAECGVGSSSAKVRSISLVKPGEKHPSHQMVFPISKLRENQHLLQTGETSWGLHPPGGFPKRLVCPLRRTGAISRNPSRAQSMRRRAMRAACSTWLWAISPCRSSRSSFVHVMIDFFTGLLLGELRFSFVSLPCSFNQILSLVVYDIHQILFFVLLGVTLALRAFCRLR